MGQSRRRTNCLDAVYRAVFFLPTASNIFLGRDDQFEEKFWYCCAMEIHECLVFHRKFLVYHFLPPPFRESRGLVKPSQPQD